MGMDRDHIAMNDELEKAIASFKPIFGDDRSISIAKQIGAYRKTQAQIAAKKKNEKAYERAVKRSTQAERDLDRIEKSLMHALIHKST